MYRFSILKKFVEFSVSFLGFQKRWVTYRSYTRSVTPEPRKTPSQYGDQLPHFPKTVAFSLITFANYSLKLCKAKLIFGPVINARFPVYSSMLGNCLH